MSRTLNFVFRQMNQEFITILHLVDVRVGYFNGFNYKEVALPELDSLLNIVIIDDIKRDIVKKSIVDELENIYDFEDKHNSFIEEKEIFDKNGNVIHKYFRIKKDKKSVFEGRIEVPGIILSAKKHILRTEGVIVEALLGQGEGLDVYSKSLQELEVERRKAEVVKLNAEADRAVLINQLSKDNDKERAQVLTELICPCKSDNPSLNINLKNVEGG